jgi:signal transduction histidine kinase
MSTQNNSFRRMSVRAIVTWLAIALGGLSLLVLIELVVVTNWMHRANERMASASEGVRAAEQLDVALRAYNRERYLLARTGDNLHETELEKRTIEVNQALFTAWEHVDNEHESGLLKKIQTDAREFMARLQGSPASRANDAFAHYLEGAKEVDNIGEEVSQLINVNIDQANAARDESLHLEHLANLSALIVAAVLVISLAASLYWVRRVLYHPFGEMRETIARYTAGDVGTRATFDGPDELRIIAGQFNEMADKLAQQRETQLQFLAAIAHDLRNPLMALRLAAGVFEMRGADTPPEQLQHQLVVVRRQVERLDRMIGDFMDVSLVENGQFTLKMEPRDLRLFAHGVVELFRPTSTLHRFELSLPNESVPVLCDPTRMEQILNNLVSNAIKYSPEGGVVRVACENRGESVVLSIRDYGIGISPEDRKKLFTPFSRVGRSQSKIPGIGLGLSVTKRLVEAHGGHVELESTVGEGSTFYVHLPLFLGISSPEKTQSTVQYRT